MAEREEPTTQIHLETAVAVLDEGRTLFEDLVRSDKDLLLENLYALSDQALRAIVFERVIAARDHEGLRRVWTQAQIS